MLRFLLLCCFLLTGWSALTGPVSAQTAKPHCTGINLLDQLRAQDPDVYQTILQQAQEVENGQHIFWRINGKDGAKPSWLFGTMHVSDERITTLPKSTQQALEAADVIALETTGIGDPRQMSLAMQRNAHLIQLSGGQTLWDLLDSEEEALLRKHMREANIPTLLATHMQPWLVAAFLAVPACERARTSAGVPVLDVQIEDYAKTQKKSLIALESLSEQFSAFSTMPLDLQQQFLLQTAQMRDRSADQLETMVQLYLNRQLHLVHSWTRYENDRLDINRGHEGVEAHFNEVLVSKRNKLMFERALPLVDTGGAFIAVGALHLQGPDGLVALFQKGGYDVTPIE